jgi:VCBS repeat protein
VKEWGRPSRREAWLASPTLLLAGVLGGLVAPDAARAQCDPSFAPPSFFDCVREPLYVAAGDFDHDCRADVAATTGDNNLAVFHGNGDGTLQAPVIYSFNNAGLFNVVTGDFDGDGNLDLAVAPDTPAVDILLGNADGTFQAATAYSAGANCSYVQAADVNADGWLDLVAVVHTQFEGISVLLGNGDGTFQAPVSYLATGQPFVIAVADLSGDGTPYVLEGFTARVDVWRADALGNLQSLGSLGVHPGRFGRVLSLAFTDFDGDGNLDVAIPETTLVTFLGNGDGTFRAGVDIDLTHDGTGFVPEGVLAADFDGDGLSDVVVGSILLPEIAVLHGNGDGTLQPPVYVAARDRAMSLAAADLDADGRTDLLEGTDWDTYTNVAVLTNKGCGPTAPVRGTVDAGPGGAGPSDTLLTNGASLAPFYVVNVSAAAGASLSIAEPPSRAGRGAAFAVWLWVGWPCDGTSQVLPRGIGTTGMRTPLPPVTGRQPIRVANNTGHHQLGLENWPGPPTRPAPSVLLNLPPGALAARIGRHFYFQGVERDDRSAGTAPYSVTNGQQWVVVP